MIRLAASTGLAVGVLILILLFHDHLPRSLTAGALFYGPVFLAAGMLLPCLIGAAPILERWAPRIPFWLAVGVLAIGFMLIGLYWTRSSGEHSGDEGHYLIQAVSLYADGDLDIRNNLEEGMGQDTVAKLGRHTFHISPNSRGDHWYSLHPAGLPILLAPGVPGGIVLRHLILGLIAALTAGAIWRLCRHAGASVTASLVVLVGFSGSLYGVVYAARSLPEMLGACLIAWLCWSILVQADYPWRSAVLAGFCCAYLSWAHLRFYPAALLGVLFYGIAAVRTVETPARKLARLSLFLGLSLGGIRLYQFIQERLFVGGTSYAVDEVLFTMPDGLWLVFTDSIGLFNVFPLAIALLAAEIAWLCVAPSRRWMAVALGAMFGVVWLTSCGGINYSGGAALGGRFLLAVTPVLLPGAAVLWDRVSNPARWWLLLLALVSVALCGVELIALPALGRSFAFPYHELPVVIPRLIGLPTPFCGLAHALVVGSLTLGALICRRPRPAAMLVGLIVMLSLAWHVALGQ